MSFESEFESTSLLDMSTFFRTIREKFRKMEWRKKKRKKKKRKKKEKKERKKRKIRGLNSFSFFFLIKFYRNSDPNWNFCLVRALPGPNIFCPSAKMSKYFNFSLMNYPWKWKTSIVHSKVRVRVRDRIHIPARHFFEQSRKNLEK